MNQDTNTLTYRLMSEKEGFGPTSLLASDLLAHVTELQMLYELLAKDLDIELPEVYLSLETITSGSVCAGLKLSEETQDVDHFLSELGQQPELWSYTSPATRKHIHDMQNNLSKRKLSAELYGYSDGKPREVRISHLTNEASKWEKTAIKPKIHNINSQMTIYGYVTSVNLEKKTAYLKTRSGKIMLRNVEGDVLKHIVKSIDDNVRLKIKGHSIWSSADGKFGSLEPKSLSLFEPISKESWNAFREGLALEGEAPVTILDDLDESDQLG